MNIKTKILIRASVLGFNTIGLILALLALLI